MRKTLGGRDRLQTGRLDFAAMRTSISVSLNVSRRAIDAKPTMRVATLNGTSTNSKFSTVGERIPVITSIASGSLYTAPKNEKEKEL